VADVFISGLQHEYLVIESPDPIRHVGIELRPAGLAALASGAPARVAGAVVDAEPLLPGIGALRHAHRGAGSGAAIDALAAFAEERRAGSPDPLVVAVLGALDRDPGTAIGELAAGLGVSHRTLIARFRAATGTSPKQHAQVLRFHRFVDAVHEAGGRPDWAGLAAEHAFADQPHLIRAFRRFSGWTPTQYLALVGEHGPDAAHFVPLDQVPAQAAS
jgi:AraC-like DNA-binding protein